MHTALNVHMDLKDPQTLPTLEQPELVGTQASEATLSLSLYGNVEQMLTTSFQPMQDRCSRLTVTLPFCRMSW